MPLRFAVARFDFRVLTDWRGSPLAGCAKSVVGESLLAPIVFAAGCSNIPPRFLFLRFVLQKNRTGV